MSMNERFRVTRMLMCQVGTYNDVYSRPFEADLNSTLLMDRLAEAGEGTLNFSAAALNDVGSEMMRVSATHQGSVNIANGFSTGRLIFMLEVEFPGTGGVIAVEWLTGYTDYVGVSDARGRVNFDPRMRLFFNTATSGRRERAAYGRMNNRVNRTVQLLNGGWDIHNRNVPENEHLLRPRDVLCELAAREVDSVLDFNDHSVESVYDLRTNFGGSRVQMSFRDNVIPAHYLSRVMKSWDKLAENPEMNMSNTYSEMASIASERSLSTMRSLGFLARASQLQAGGSLTWSELVDCDDTGTLEDRVMLNLANSDRTRAQLSYRGGDDDTNGNDPETVLAVNLAQSVPALMVRYMLTYVQLRASNRDIPGSSEWVVGLGESHSFMDDGDESDLSSNLRRFRDELTDFLLPGATYGNRFDAEIDMDVDVMGETVVEVRLMGDRHGRRFRLPSFCDSAYTPVRSFDAEPLSRLGQVFDRVFTSIQTDHSVPAGAIDVTSSIMDKYNNGNSGAL